MASGSSDSYTSEMWEWDGANWRLISTISGPEPLVGAAGAYDSLRQRVLIYGGYAKTLKVRANTWTWNGLAWKQLDPMFPTPMFGVPMTYDPARQRVVMFGGYDGSNLRSEVWEHDGVRWKLIVPTGPSPVVSAFQNIAYCPDRKTILHLETLTNPPSSAIWEWNGKSWTKRSTPTWPPWRRGASLAYDQARRRLVLFGGSSATSVYLNDTWEWDGTAWQQQSPTASPPPRSGALMAFDESLGQIVLVSGSASAGLFPDTWTYDGKTWRQIASSLPAFPDALAYDSLRGRLVLVGTQNSSAKVEHMEWDGTAWNLIPHSIVPPSRFSPALAYDSARQRMVLYGGNDGGPLIFQPFYDTWELATSYPAGFTALGQGCTGSFGVPQLAIEPAGYPWLGDTALAQVRNLGLSPSQHLPFGLLGDSNSRLGTIPLPLDLTSLGMPGCSLCTNALLTFPLVNRGGNALWSMPIPFDLALAGLSLYPQAGSLDPGANALGIVLSNAGELKIGWR